MEVKSKHFMMNVGITKKVPDIAVCMCIPLTDINEQALRKLLCNCACSDSLCDGYPESAIAFSLYEMIRDKFVSSALEVSKSKVSNISCCAIDNMLCIKWNCQGTGSSLRKTCGIAVSCLQPQRMFSKFSDNIKFLTGKGAHKEHFFYVAKKLSDAIKKGIHFSAVGRINIDIPKLKDICSVIENKFPTLENIEKGEKPVCEKNETNNYPMIKSSGLASACVADYIRSNSNGMGVQVVKNGVLIYNTSWESKKKTLSEKRRINDYVDKKYKRLGVDFPNLFAYFISTQHYANSETISKIIKSKLKVEQLKDIIYSALKK